MVPGCESAYLESGKQNRKGRQRIDQRSLSRGRTDSSIQRDELLVDRNLSPPLFIKVGWYMGPLLTLMFPYSGIPGKPTHKKRSERSVKARKLKP